MRIDAHQHFWKYDPVRDSWIGEEMQSIRQDFLPVQLLPLLQQEGFDGCVLVQSDSSEAGNAFLLSLAAANPFIKGIVGWIDPQANNIEESLSYYRQFNIIKGFRYVLQGELDRALMLKPDFKRGIAALGAHNFTYDLLIYPDQLKYVSQLVALFPNQKFVVDHIAKPFIRSQKIAEWKEDITNIAQYKNVYCKISGLVTEADWGGWKNEDIIPYIDAVVTAFGTNRIMFGSDWPVCLLAASYTETVALVKDYFTQFSKVEQGLFFGDNAIAFYDL